MDKKVENLMLYKVAYELLLYLNKDVVKFYPREFKYTLGERLKNKSLDLLVILYETNLKPVDQRQKDIENLLVILKTIEIMTKLSYDLKCVNLNKFNHLNNLIIQLRKMLYGWKRLIKEV